MATSDIINTLDRDMFRNPRISKEEMFRRLSQLVEVLYTIISQTEGGTITNIYTTIYAAPIPEEVDAGELPVISDGISVTRIVFNVNGETVEAKFTDGKLVS